MSFLHAGEVLASRTVHLSSACSPGEHLLGSQPQNPRGNTSEFKDPTGHRHDTDGAADQHQVTGILDNRPPAVVPESCLFVERAGNELAGHSSRPHSCNRVVSIHPSNTIATWSKGRPSPILRVSEVQLGRRAGVSYDLIGQEHAVGSSCVEEASSDMNGS